MKTCKSCGALSDGSRKYCVNCGAELPEAEKTYSEPEHSGSAPAADSAAGGGSEGSGFNSVFTGGGAQLHENVNYGAELEAYINNNADHYIGKFAAIDNSSKRSSWNWASFFFGGFWFIYRKMYGLGAAMIAIQFFLELIGALSGFSLLFVLILKVVLGSCANSIYKSRVESDLRQVKDVEEPKKSLFIKKRGGVSFGAVIVSYVLVRVLDYIIAIALS